jgi:serine protease Do
MSIKKRKPFLIVITACFMGVIALMSAGIVAVPTMSGGTMASEALAAGSADMRGAPPSFADLAERLKPAVVNIRTTKTLTSGGMAPFSRHFGQRGPFDQFFGDEFFKRFFGDMPQRQYKQRSLGSGFIISNDGYIFTNFHVVEKADEIIVKLSDDREYTAKTVGKDKNTDIALLKIETDDSLPVAKLGDSSDLRVGDWVIAIGNPFGLSQTVTAGIVSAKGRVIGAGPYDDFIQTDASINPGNSGGPLFNLAGEVVGINTAIVAQGQGIGFAIPVNMAKGILPDLKEKGKVIRGWLGVSVQDITEELAKSLDLKNREGALIADVFKGDPADRAGIEPKDVIIAVDGKPVKDTHDLLRLIAEKNVGHSVKVTIVRNGDQKVYTVKIAERPEQETLAQRETTGEFFGISVQEITPEIAQHLGLSSTDGVIVRDVQDGSPADEAGIMVQDVILEVNKVKIVSISDYEREMKKAYAKGSALLWIERNGEKTFIPVQK